MPEQETRWTAKLGAIFRDARTQLGLSLRELEERSGVSNSQIHRLEAGDFEISLATYVKLATVLGLPKGLLLDRLFSPLVTWKTEYAANLEADEDCKRFLSSLGFGFSDLKDTEGYANHETAMQFIKQVAGVALHVAVSTMPVAAAKVVVYPSQELLDSFVSFASRIQAEPSTQERAALIHALRTSTFRELARQGLCSERLVRGYMAPRMARVVHGKTGPFTTRKEVVDFVMGGAARSASEREGVGLWLASLPDVVPVNTPDEPIAQTSTGVEIEKNLTKKSDHAKSSPMPTWAQLKTDVQRLTTERGSKAALARYCGVTPQAVATWLDPKSTTEPGAEATLKLLEWVKTTRAPQAAKAKPAKTGKR